MYWLELKYELFYFTESFLCMDWMCLEYLFCTGLDWWLCCSRVVSSRGEESPLHSPQPQLTILLCYSIWSRKLERNVLNINKISIIASNMDMLGLYEKVEGSVDVVIMQMAAMLLWLGLRRWRIILWLHLAKLGSLWLILSFSEKAMKRQERKYVFYRFPAFLFLTVDCYFRGSTSLGRTSRDWRAGPGVLVYTDIPCFNFTWYLN